MAIFFWWILMWTIRLTRLTFGLVQIPFITWLLPFFSTDDGKKYELFWDRPRFNKVAAMKMVDMKMAGLNLIYPGKNWHVRPSLKFCLRGPWSRTGSEPTRIWNPGLNRTSTSRKMKLRIGPGPRKFSNLGPFRTDRSVDPCHQYKLSSDFQMDLSRSRALVRSEVPSVLVLFRIDFREHFPKFQFSDLVNWLKVIWR